MAVAIAAAAFFALVLIRRGVRNHHQRLLKTERSEILEVPLEVLSRTTILFFGVLALFAGAQYLTVNPKAQRVLMTLVTITSFWQVGVWVAAAASGWLRRKRHVSLGSDNAVIGSLGIIGFIINAVIWSMVLLLTLDNLGVNIGALVAGLGIGGVAVALAVQNVLGDLFASLSITLDKPFVVGDFLSIDDVLGSVEYIGVKSTRLRSLGGEQIIMANSDLLKSRVHNYGRMGDRRVVFATVVTYDTPLELIEKIPAMIREIVTAEKDVRFDRSHFAKHGAAALEFETVYFVLSTDYNRYMDIQQSINLKLHRRFRELDIHFSYPTQRFVLSREVTDQGEEHQETQAGAEPRAREFTNEPTRPVRRQPSSLRPT